MILSLIAAMTPHRVIGKDNQLPWQMPADLAHFKQLTLGKPIVMGRKTHESIGRPLPGRTNVIVTRNKEFKAEGCEIFHDLEEALESLVSHPEICIIGGSELFQACLPKANFLYLTFINADIKGDVFFPEFNPEEFHEISRENHTADENNPYDYCFITLSKKTSTVA